MPAVGASLQRKSTGQVSSTDPAVEFPKQSLLDAARIHLTLFLSKNCFPLTEDRQAQTQIGLAKLVGPRNSRPVWTAQQTLFP